MHAPSAYLNPLHSVLLYSVSCESLVVTIVTFTRPLDFDVHATLLLFSNVVLIH